MFIYIKPRRFTSYKLWNKCPIKCRHIQELVTAIAVIKKESSLPRILDLFHLPALCLRELGFYICSSLRHCYKEKMSKCVETV